MNNLAIIPARGGSKRIPRKNIKEFLGKPIIAYSVETALRSQLFSKVLVSTDDEEIASIARQFGADVPFLRSTTNAGDHSTTMDVLVEVQGKLIENNERFDNICCIYPTAPLMQEEHLKEGYQKLTGTNVQTVLPVARFSYPVWRGVELENSGRVQMKWPENSLKRTQDLTELYHDAGQWYWFKDEYLDQGIFHAKTYSIVLEDIFVQDIDNLSDWEIAELKYEKLQKS